MSTKKVAQKRLLQSKPAKPAPTTLSPKRVAEVKDALDFVNLHSRMVDSQRKKIANRLHELVTAPGKREQALAFEAIVDCLTSMADLSSHVRSNAHEVAWRVGVRLEQLS